MQRWVPEPEKEYLEKIHCPTYMSVGSLSTQRSVPKIEEEYIEKNKGINGPANMSMGSPSTQRWVPEMEEEHIEKNPRPGIHVHRLTLYAKVAHPLGKDGSSN
jgi:hypothetical protein